MKFAHISDIHLGFSQYESEDRISDMYDAFNQSVDKSIEYGVNFIIFSGDLFHKPVSGGTALSQMAKVLQKLKENNIKSYFILGEHDLSRVRSHPTPFLYDILDFTKYIGDGSPVYHDGILLIGFDKVRRGALEEFEEKFKKADDIAKNHQGHKILVLHQGLIEVNKFAGELTVNDLPKNFTYYAMGHLHDKFSKSFDILGGPLAYPGSTEATGSEETKDTKKGFFLVDISTPEAKLEWIALDRRRQISRTITYDKLEETVDELLKECEVSKKQPIIEIKINGDDIKPDLIQAEISRLDSKTLNCSWKTNKPKDDSTVFMNRPADIKKEMLKLAINAVKSKPLAEFAVNSLYPLLSSDDVDQATQVVIDDYAKFKEEAAKC